MQALAATPRNGELGFWMAGLADKRRSYPRFTGQDSVDLAIVGGGYTGLCAAYFAKKIEPSLSVAVFEGEQIGYGASGAGLRKRNRTDNTSLVGYRSRKWEPEPIRWLGVRGMYRLFGLADQWEEHRDSNKTSLLARFGSRLAGLHEQCEFRLGR